MGGRGVIGGFGKGGPGTNVPAHGSRPIARPECRSLNDVAHPRTTPS